MIGSWDNSNVVFALLPKLEAQFRTADANTGFANLYNGPSGGSITATMTNMASGYGFRATEKDYNFDGANDYISIPDNDKLDGIQGLTIASWVYDNDIDTVGDCTILNKRGTTRPYNLSLIDSANRVILQSESNTQGLTQLYSDLDVRTNGLSFFCATWDYTDNFLRLYKNGVSIATPVAMSGSILAPNTSDVFIGIESTGGRPLNGKIEGLIVYSRGLSLSEISTLNALGPTLGGGITATDLGSGLMGLETTVVPSGSNRRKSKNFKFGNSFPSWSNRKKDLR